MYGFQLLIKYEYELAITIKSQLNIHILDLMKKRERILW